MTNHANTDLVADHQVAPVDGGQHQWSSPAPISGQQFKGEHAHGSGRAPLSGYSAIAAVAGLLGSGIPIVGGLTAITLGILGLRQVSRSDGYLRGRWMAVVGLGFGTIGLIVSSLWITGQFESVADVTLAPGACVTFDPTIELVTSDEVVPCDSPHTAEYAGSGTLPDDQNQPYPGEDPVFAAGAQVCMTVFANYMGLPFDSRPDLDLFVTHPSAQSWGTGERGVACYIGNFDQSPLVGQLTP